MLGHESIVSVRLHMAKASISEFLSWGSPKRHLYYSFYWQKYRFGSSFLRSGSPKRNFLYSKLFVNKSIGLGAPELGKPEKQFLVSFSLHEAWTWELLNSGSPRGHFD